MFICVILTLVGALTIGYICLYLLFMSERDINAFSLRGACSF